MKLLSLYKPFAGSMTEFTNTFKNNEALYNQSRSFWGKLEGVSVIILIIMFVLGIALACAYYKPYNNMPGRHYKPIHWVYFLLGTFVLTFLVTLGFEYFAVEPKLQGSFLLEFRIALGNACYALLLFLLVSFFWCKFGTTNAYKIF